MSDSLIKVVTPTIPAVGTDSGRAAIACPAASVVASGIGHAIAMTMSSDAADVSVEIEPVLKISRKFQCTELADVLETTGGHLAQMKEATRALAGALSVKQPMLEALESTKVCPTHTKGSLFCGKRQFRTRRGKLWCVLWHLLHPEMEMLSAFYRAIQQSEDTNLSMETIYTAASEHVSWKAAEDAASQYADRFAQLLGEV